MSQETHNETPNSALQVANSILQRSFDEKDEKGEEVLISHLEVAEVALHFARLALGDHLRACLSRTRLRLGLTVLLCAEVYNAFRGYGDKPIDALGDDKTCVRCVGEILSPSC